MRSRVVVLPLIAVSVAGALCAGLVSADPKAAKTLLDEGRMADAIAMLRQDTEQDSENTEAWGVLGEAYLRSDKVDSAAMAAEKHIELEDDWSLGYALLARAQVRKGDVKAAQETVKKGLEKSEKRRGTGKESSSPILAAQGVVLLASNSVDEAVIVLTQAKEEDPTNAVAIEALGDAYFKRGIPALAVTQYELAVQMDSTDAARNHKLAQAYMKDRRYNDAARAFERVLKMNPENSAAILDLSRIYVASKHYNEAVPILGEYVKREPESVEGWTLYLQALSNTSQHEQILATANRVLELTPGSVEALRAKAAAQAELKQPQEAVATYQTLAATDSLRSEDYRMLGKAYADLKQDDLAVSNFEKALATMDENMTDLYNDLGFAYMRMKNYERASDMFERRFQADTTAVGAYLNYALSNMALQRWDRAGPALHKVTTMRPDYVTGHVYLAKYYASVDSSQAALATFEKVIQMVAAMPDTAQARYQKDLAEAHSQIGITHLLAKPPRLDPALAALTKAITIKDDDPQTRLWRAQTYALMNRRDEAIEEYKAVLRLDPQNEQAKKDLALFNQ